MPLRAGKLYCHDRISLNVYSKAQVLLLQHLPQRFLRDHPHRVHWNRSSVHDHNPILSVQIRMQFVVI